MKYNNFINILKEFVDNKKLEARSLYNNQIIINQIDSMLDQKFNHTKRVVDCATFLATRLNMHVNYDMIVSKCGLFHDIGRFNQALLYKTYNDSQSFSDGKSHGDYGYELINSNSSEAKIFDNIVEEVYQPIVSEIVRFHQRGVLPDNYNKKDILDIKDIDPNSIVTGSNFFNYLEEQIISSLLHIVRDSDRIDILWQRATGEIVPFKDCIYLRNTGNIDEFAKRWGISKEVVLNNNSRELLFSNPYIKIPREAIPIDKLFVSDELFDKMKNLDNIDLRFLQQDKRYTFITALWWSIYTFLKDMNFAYSLEIIEDKKILAQIYNVYPKEYKVLIDDIFKFAKEVLIEERLANNKDMLYINKKIIR